MRDVTVELKALRLHGMASAWCDLAEQGTASGLDASRWLVEHLLQAETTDRSMRSVQHQMSSARFPVHRDLAGFDFDASVVDQKLVHQLAMLEFTEAAHNVVLVGGPGTGKTHLATALGVSGRRRAAGQSSAVRRAVPIRTFGDWDDPAPGYLEVDFVAHCGPQLAGSFIQTLVLTDVATGWTECVPVLTRDSTLVIDAIDRARALFSFPMRGIDFDNDSVFMNERVVGWCRAEGLERDFEGQAGALLLEHPRLRSSNVR